jgi:hypothetical protein
MALTNEQKYLLNNFLGPIAKKLGLGDVIAAAEAVVESEIAIADGKILIGNGSGVAVARTLSGDVTTTNAGVTAIGASKVVKTMLASAIRPSHIAVYAGEFTTVGGDADEAISISGVLATDLVHVTLHTKGATPRTILQAQADTDVINVVMSGDPSTDHILTYSVLRATT